MSTSNLSSKSAGAGVFAAIVASLCCITPVFSLLAGIGGIAATFSWMEPFRPYFIALTIGALGFAWYHKLKQKTTEEVVCACEDDKPSFWQTKKFLSIVTVFATLMLVFPSYSHIFYNNNPNSSIMMAQDSTQTATLTVNVKGMTCSGCESHIVHEVNKLNGIKSVTASYAKGSASVEYVLSKVKRDDIITAINNTGYKVMDTDSETISPLSFDDEISFYKVPLVCNAAPSIGCGSRSKPVLNDFEKSDLVKEAWLNRTGTVVAIVWNHDESHKGRRQLTNEIFDKHGMKVSALMSDDFANSMDSFSKREGWYKGADVNKLSKEEAEIIADQLMIPIMEKTKMNAVNQQKMKDKMVNMIYDFFLNYKSITELSDPEIYKAMIAEFIEYGETIVGKGNMPTQDQLWNACSNGSKSCNHKSCSSSCSTKKS
ncbi:mercuric transport protein MerTP [Reichenbachiella sp.]|uniref:mercuric transport protein MerTP n=1 Tax=Reichenbachiella sp. TaxID=2184521 RepID=UPI003BB0D432